MLVYHFHRHPSPENSLRVGELRFEGDPTSGDRLPTAAFRQGASDDRTLDPHNRREEVRSSV